MKKKYLLIAAWVLVLAIAFMIFLFSSQDGDISSKTSGEVVQWLLHLFVPSFDQLPAAERAALLSSWQFAIRKAAHFSEFALLGLSLRYLFHLLPIRLPSFFAWLVGTLYACTDELHQTLVSKRAGMWQDVCIDSAGVLFGVIALLLILYLRKKRKKSIAA